MVFTSSVLSFDNPSITRSATETKCPSVCRAVPTFSQGLLSLENARVVPIKTPGELGEVKFSAA